MIALGIRPAAAQQKFYDYVIKDALVFDGESYRESRVDVGFTGRYISAVGNIPADHGVTVIQAKGRILAPGFIDTHTHSDFNPLVYPGLSNKITQGVTTEVVGNCGMSAAPLEGTHRDRFRDLWAREGVLIQGPVNWTTYAEYVREVEILGLRQNWVGLVGHGNLRSAVMGFDPRPAAASEVLLMQEKLRESMKAGARGISFGLIYIPGTFAGTEEITELCREAARQAGLCAFHMRNEGAALVEAVEEVIGVARETGAAVQISHLKAGTEDSILKIGEVFKRIEAARLDGLDIEADAYPYTAGYAELGVVLPDDLYQREDRSAYFQNPLVRQELIDRLIEYYDLRHMKWDWIRIGSVVHKDYQADEGKTIREVALERDVSPERFLVELLADNDFQVSAFYFTQDPEVVFEVFKKPYVSVGSDSIADGTRKPHPRAYGTFPKVFREMVRGEKILKLGEAIRKMTSLPAKHFRLEKRGQIRPGYFADLVLLDAGNVRDDATYDLPTQKSRGVEWVFVNGVPVVREGEVTAEKPGTFLR